MPFSSSVQKRSTSGQTPLKFTTSGFAAEHVVEAVGRRHAERRRSRRSRRRRGRSSPASSSRARRARGRGAATMRFIISEPTLPVANWKTRSGGFVTVASFRGEGPSRRGARRARAARRRAPLRARAEALGRRREERGERFLGERGALRGEDDVAAPAVALARQAPHELRALELAEDPRHARRRLADEAPQLGRRAAHVRPRGAQHADRRELGVVDAVGASAVRCSSARARATASRRPSRAKLRASTSPAIACHAPAFSSRWSASHSRHRAMRAAGAKQVARYLARGSRLGRRVRARRRSRGGADPQAHDAPVRPVQLRGASRLAAGLDPLEVRGRHRAAQQRDPAGPDRRSELSKVGVAAGPRAAPRSARGARSRS